MSRKFCLNADLHVTFRDLLHAVKLRHGTDGFTSPPKEGQHATSRPSKPLNVNIVLLRVILQIMANLYCEKENLRT